MIKFLALAALFTLAACGDKDDTADSGEAAEAADSGK